MKVVKTETFNTNNAWGFGGSIGRREYYDNGIITITGTGYTRHSGTYSANRVHVLIEDGFSIPVIQKADGHNEVRKLDGIEAISIFSCPDDRHFQAVAKDIDELELYGKQYKLIRKITL